MTKLDGRWLITIYHSYIYYTMPIVSSSLLHWVGRSFFADGGICKSPNKYPRTYNFLSAALYVSKKRNNALRTFRLVGPSLLKIVRLTAVLLKRLQLYVILNWQNVQTVQQLLWLICVQVVTTTTPLSLSIILEWNFYVISLHLLLAMTQWR